MRIPIAIYTAIEGYAWQPDTELSIAFLNKVKAKIGKFPDSSIGELPFGGAVTTADKLVIYRYHLAKNMDSFGRNALYVVLGAIPRLEAGRVNMKRLLDLPTFAKPQKPLPHMFVDYEGPASASCPFDLSHSTVEDFGFVESLAWLGSALSVPDGKVSLACSPAVELLPRLRLVYEAPPPPPPPPLPRTMMPVPVRSSPDWRSLALFGIVCFLAGILFALVTSSAFSRLSGRAGTPEKRDNKPPAKQVPTEGLKSSVGSVNNDRWEAVRCEACLGSGVDRKKTLCWQCNGTGRVVRRKQGGDLKGLKQ